MASRKGQQHIDGNHSQHEAYGVRNLQPGYKKENVRAELKDGYLTIFAEASGSSEDSESRNFLRKERYSGSCKRSFYVGSQ